MGRWLQLYLSICSNGSSCRDWNQEVFLTRSRGGISSSGLRRCDTSQPAGYNWLGSCGVGYFLCLLPSLSVFFSIFCRTDSHSQWDGFRKCCVWLALQVESIQKDEDGRRQRSPFRACFSHICTVFMISRHLFKGTAPSLNDLIKESSPSVPGGGGGPSEGVGQCCESVPTLSETPGSLF